MKLEDNIQDQIIKLNSMNTSTKQSSNETENGNKSKPLLQAVFLLPYVPHRLYCMVQGEGKTKFDLQGVSDINWIDLHEKDRTVNEQYDVEDVIPILKPLGDLTKDEKTCEEINDFLEPNGLEINNFLLLKNSLNAVAISWEEIQNVLNILYREHYDVFGLINKRLAISVHDVV